MLLTACSSGSDEPAADEDADAPTQADGADTTDDRPRELVLAHAQEPPNWDWTQTSATAVRVPLAYNVIEPLLEGLEDGTFEPLLAESYAISDDGLTYTFTIREATFHDGSTLDAADVVYSLEYNRESPHGQVAVPFEAVESIEATDDRTVTVTLSRPSQRFHAGMAADSGLIMPEGGAETVAESPVGTGAFDFVDWRVGVDVELERFDDYWGELPYFEAITWRFIADETAGLSALLAGDIDAFPSLVGEGVERLDSIDAEDGLTAVFSASPELGYISLNASAEVFQDERIVQAINHAIDRQPYLDGAHSGRGETTCVFVNPVNAPWNSDYCPYPFDQDKARSLLAEAGASDLTIPFRHLTIADHGPIHDILVAQLTEVGITVESEPRELAVYLDEVLGETPDYVMTQLGGPSKIDAWVCPGRFTLLCDEEFDDLLARADASTDFDEYVDLRREAVERHAELGYLIPLFTKVGQGAWRDDIAGIKLYNAASEVDMRGLHWAD